MVSTKLIYKNDVKYYKSIFYDKYRGIFEIESDSMQHNKQEYKKWQKNTDCAVFTSKNKRKLNNLKTVKYNKIYEY